MKIKTSELKFICENISSVIKEDKARPVTELMQIFIKDDSLYFGMTDNVSRIVGSVAVEGELFSAVIKITSLLKLIKLTTKEDMELNLKKDYIEVKGNGKYKIPLETDQGEQINLKLDMPEVDEFVSYDLLNIKKATARNKLSLYTGDAHIEYAKYYSDGNMIVTSDGMSVCAINGELFEEEVVPFVIDQLVNLTAESAKYHKTENGYYFKTPKFEYYTRAVTTTPFPADIVMPYVDIKEDSDMFGDTIKVRKLDLTNAIKRLSLFKSRFGIPSFNLTISPEYVTIEDTQGNASEELELIEKSVNKTTTIRLEAELILKMLRSMEQDIIVHSGFEDAIILEDEIGLFVVSKVEE